MFPKFKAAFYFFWLAQCFVLVSRSHAGALSNSDAGTVKLTVNDNRPCENSPIVFEAEVTGMGASLSYKWMRGSTVMGITTSNTFTFDNSSPPIDYEADGFTCVVTDNVTGERVESNAIEHVNVLAHGPLTMQIYFQTTTNVNTLTVCKGAPVTIVAAAGHGYQYLYDEYHVDYEWRLNGVVFGNNESYLELTTLNDQDQITCVATVSGKCRVGEVTPVSNTLVINVLPELHPAVNIASDNGGCAGATSVYTATATDLGTGPAYQWMVNGNFTGTNSNTYTGTLLANDKVECKVTGSTVCGFEEATSNQITISDIPLVNNSVVLTSSAANNIITEHQSITFTADASYKVNVVYEWYVNGTKATDSGPTFTSSNLTLGDKVWCQVSTRDNCVIPQTVLSNVITVIIIKPIVIPNTFTPNGDGINDTWSIPALLAYPNCSIRLYNRNGALLYISKGYTSGWDGIANGKQLPTGVYYYVVKPGDKSPAMAGSLTLIR